RQPGGQDRPPRTPLRGKATPGTAMTAAAGGNAAVTTVKDQTRQHYAGTAGDKVAAAAFSAPAGAVVGPVQGAFGWVVVKVDSVKSIGGKTLAQAKGEIADKLNVEKRKQAIEDIVTHLQNAVDQGN